MKLDTKAQIAKVTLSTLTGVVSLFLLSILVLVLCAGLQIDPFRESTTTFLLSAFAGLIGVASVLVLLNVATSVSLIADAKIAELKIEPRPGLFRKWLIGFFAIAAILVVFIFAGTYFSKKLYLAVVRTQADEVLKENSGLLGELSRRLATGKFEDFKRIFEIRNFLAHQRSGLPELTLVYSGNFADKLAFYKVSQDYFPGDSEKGIYTPIYFPCTKNLDCDYLTRFFSGGNVDPLENYTVRNDQFYIYIPFIGKEARFILLFEKWNRYGKFGS